MFFGAIFVCHVGFFYVRAVALVTIVLIDAINVTYIISGVCLTDSYVYRAILRLGFIFNLIFGGSILYFTNIASYFHVCMLLIQLHSV